jgi:hypothetical protein
MIGFGQITMIPDPNFEQKLIDLGYDNVLDGSVNTASIDTVTFLFVSNSNISDLTGIEDFTSLTSLYCGSNNLTSLDVSINTSLGYLSCNYNQITNLDVSQNTSLLTLVCSNNQLTSLDMSQNTSLLLLVCSNNQLTSLDVRNGNNINMTLSCQNNPNLICINVDDGIYSLFNWTNNIDPQTNFSENCGATSLEELTTNKELLKVTNLIGRETNNQNQPLIYFYNDGTVEKKVIIE